MNQPDNITQRELLKTLIQQTQNTAFQQSSLARAYVDCGLTAQGKECAETASKLERAALTLTKQLEEIPAEASIPAK